MTYVVADLHGRFDLLDAALKEISQHAPTDGGTRTVVFLGDYVDRGPDSKKVLDRLMKGPPRGWKWICLKGNHEDMMVSALRREVHPDHWFSNGGVATLDSFGSRSLKIDPSYRDWIDHLRLIHLDKHRLFVHAGVDPSIPLNRQNEHDLLWRRDNGPEGYGEYHVVHGHTPDPNGPLLFPGRTNLDTLAWYTGRLVVGVFDDEVPGGPVDFIEIERSGLTYASIPPQPM